VIFSVWILCSLAGKHQCFGGKLRQHVPLKHSSGNYLPVFILHQPEFSPRSVYVGLVVDKVALGQVFYLYLPRQLSFHDMLHFFPLLLVWYSGPYTVLRYSISPHTKDVMKKEVVTYQTSWCHKTQDCI
jgi:hypothetical protein